MFKIYFVHVFNSLVLFFMVEIEKLFTSDQVLCWVFSWAFEVKGKPVQYCMFVYICLQNYEVKHKSELIC